MYKKYQAPYLFTGYTMLNQEHVLLVRDNGIVEAVVPATEIDTSDAFFFDGMLTPGFINCHCHLELSHLKNILPKHTGLVQFILGIIQQRNAEESIILKAIEKAEKAMKANGIVAVGDISNNTSTLEQKKKNNLYYHNFIEVSGFNPAIANDRFKQGFDVYNEFKKSFDGTTSLVPHAPYSVSKALFGLINNLPNNNKLLSIHNQETFDENAFFTVGSGEFNDLYKSLGIDISTFHYPTKKNSLQSVVPLLTAPEKLILVHNTFSGLHDVKFLQQLNAYQEFIFCICIKANLYIENETPPLYTLYENNCTIVIGTDSLASNNTLSILEELKTIHKHFNDIPITSLMQWATINGANALGISEQFGSFEKGKQPGIVGISAIDDNGYFTKQSKIKLF